VRRVIKVLAVAALVALMLVASISPALAKAVRGGVLLQTTMPCVQNRDYAQNIPGSHLQTDVPGRAPGCWVLLPLSAPQE
jgi:hypothetical protein